MEVIIGSVNLTNRKSSVRLKTLSNFEFKIFANTKTSHGIWSLELVLMHPNDGIKNKEENACRL